MSNYNSRNEALIEKLVWVLIYLYILFFGYINFLKYQSFEYKDFDLAVYAQTMWNILHGSIYSSILGIDFLGNHASFILFLITPIYFVFRHPLTLLFLQTLSLGIAVYPIYLIAKNEINETVGLTIVFVYLLYPPLGYVNLFEFHPTVFATSFLVFMFYYFKRQNFKRFTLFMILSLFCQENIPLIIVPVGIYAFFTKRSMRWILTPVFLGIVWFLVVVGKVIPHFNNYTIQFISLYRHLGKSIPEVFEFVITHPIEVGKMIFTKQKMIFISQIFMPLSFFSLLGPQVLIISLALLQHLLSFRQTEHTIYYHYTAEIIPFIFISAIYGIKRFLRISYIKTHLRQGVFLLLMITVAVTSNIHLGPQLGLVSSINRFKKDIWDCQKERFLNIVPTDASVIATFEFLPKLSHRKDLYSFHHIVMGFYTLSDKPYYLPKGVEYALIDFNDSLTFNSFYIPGRADANLRNFIIANKWGIVDMLGSLVLLKRDHLSKYNFYQVLKKIPRISNTTAASVDNELEFVGYDVNCRKKIFRGKQVELTFYWKALKKVKRDYGNFIDIIDERGKLRYRFIKPICYRIFPTYLWQRQEIVKEDYNLLIPEDIKKDTYSIRIGMFDYKTKKIYPMFSSLPDTIDNGGRVNLINLESCHK